MLTAVITGRRAAAVVRGSPIHRCLNQLRLVSFQSFSAPDEPHPPNSDTEAAKRGPGRPKGSKNEPKARV